MKRFAVLLIVSVSLCSHFLFAQDAAPSPEDADSRTVYVIRSMDFDSEGRSRPFAIIYNGEFREGERLEGEGALERYITRKTQLLMNQRVLEEVSIEYTLGSPEADGAVPVNLLIRTKDTWNIIALPYPQYDSNEGLKIIIKARDYNFFGTMSALRVDLGYHRDNDDNNSFNFEIDSDIPFYAAGLNWSVNFDHIFEYTVGDPLYYKNVTGVSIELPVSLSTATLGINQYLIINESNSEQNQKDYNLGPRMDGPYAASELFASWRIPLGIEVGEFGNLAYTPKLSGKIAYKKGGVDEPRRPVTSLSQTVGFGRINWIGNYRKGLEANLSNSNNFFFDPKGWSVSAGAAAVFHWPFTKFIGVSTRLEYQHWFNDINYSAGTYLRGVLNADLHAEYMLTLNLDFPFRLLRFYPSEWFNNRKLHFFDFEMHLSPFMDIAMLKGPYNDTGIRDNEYDGNSFSLNDVQYAGGFEIIVFPAFMRSLYLRASVGYDINKIRKTGDIPKWNEIFIGIGHHY
ncbi:MAG: hypothetical protein LBC62_10150 [Treponema sp.]|jgi:hypothetical protein|nr:hypothetical protein [Treponema sp.]